MFPVDRASDTGLADDDGTNMMRHSDVRQLGSVEQFESVHSDNHLTEHNEDITIGDQVATPEAILKCKLAEGDTEDGHTSNHEAKNLDDAGDVMVDEASSVPLVEFRVVLAIKPLCQELLEEVVLDEEHDDQDDGENQLRVRHEIRHCAVLEVNEVRWVAMLSRVGSGVQHR